MDAGASREPLELFTHAAPELKHALNAQSILGIPFSVEQEAALCGGVYIYRPKTSTHIALARL